MAGLPRWAWIALIAGGVGVGLYLHSRNPDTEETEETEELPGGRSQSLEEYEGTNAGGGLQALGVAGPVPQATVPIESPVVPEGFTDTIGSQADTIQGLANGVLEDAIAANELAGALAVREPNREIIREKMVGHPPKRKVHHKAPARKPKKKIVKKQVKKPIRKR